MSPKLSGVKPQEDHEYLKAASQANVEAFCSTCIFWMPDGGSIKDLNGECRKNTPSDEGWPSTHREDWCGSWRPSIESGVEF